MAIIDNDGSVRVLGLGGPAGNDGKSAYQSWLALGNSGSEADYLASLKGKDGRNGIDGQPGAGTVTTRRAAASFPDNSCAVDVGNGAAVVADPLNAAHRGKLIGFVRSGGDVGAVLNISLLGPITGVSGDFGPNDRLYPGIGGGLTRALPEGATWRQIVGQATTATEIVFAPGEARVIDSGSFVLPNGDAALQAAILRILDGRPYLPADPADYPDAGGLFKNGDPATDGGTYTIVRIPPKA